MPGANLDAPVNRLDAVMHVPVWVLASIGFLLIVESLVLFVVVTALLRLLIAQEEKARRAAKLTIAGRPPIAVPGRADNLPHKETNRG